MQRRTPQAALAAALLSLSGCLAGQVTSRAMWDPDTWTFRHLSDEPVVLPVPRPVAVDVQSFNGGVFIACDPRLTQATVSIVREAMHGYGRVDESDASLAEIDYRVELAETDLGPTLQVRTWTIHREPYFQRAHVRIDLPAAKGVRVRTQRGKVYAIDVGGPIDIETSEGDVRVMTERPIREPVRITNRQADIDYRVTGDSAGVFDCQAAGGSVDHRVRFGPLVIHAGTDHDTLRATLGEGGSPVLLRAIEGDVRIAVVPDPKAVGSHIVGP